MSGSCGCCSGVHVVTPRVVVNRPGLPRLEYRIGTHGSFMASMIARLSSKDHPSLAGLTTRDPDDASIALLDGWATIADVLTFYQERIANEGYLRTATERRSILELGRLVGWMLRPGISATAYLSYTVDPDPQDPGQDRRVTIPKGSQAQSIPDPGLFPPTQVTPVALPQTFETTDDLEARALWSRLEPRRRRPMSIGSDDLDTLAALYLDGILTNLKPDGRLVLEFSNPGPVAVRIASITTDFEADVTTVKLLGTRAKALAALKTDIAMTLAAVTSDNGLSPTQRELADGVLTDLARAVTAAPSLDAVEAALATEIDSVTELALAYRERGWSKVAAWAEAIRDDLAGFRAEAIALSRAPFDLAASDAVAGALVGAVAGAVVAEAPGGLAVAVAKEDQPIGQPRGLDLALLGALRKPPSIPPRDSRTLSREAKDIFRAGSAEATQLLTTLDRRLSLTLDRSLEALPGEPSALASVSAMRIKCQPFGSTAPLRPIVDKRGIVVGTEEWPLSGEAIVGFTARFENGKELNELQVTLETGGESFEVQLRAPKQGAELGKVGDVQVEWAKPTVITISAAAIGQIEADLEVLPTDAVHVRVGPAAALDLDVEVPLEGKTRRSMDGHFYDVSYIGQPDESDALTLVLRQPLPPSPPDVIYLDAEYAGIVPGSWVVIERPDHDPAVFVASVIDVRTVARADYGLTAKVTRIKLSAAWLDDTDLLLSAIRPTTVFVLSEPLKLALEPFDDDICGDTIELQRLYPALQTGRWIIVEGERTDVPASGGVRTAELAMIAGVAQGSDPVRLTDSVHTYLTLAKPLAYCYRRASATIHGNVAKATHGETRTEALGSGDAASSLQTFPLRAKPLTYAADSSALGAASTLELRVDTVRWYEAESLVNLGPKDHGYILKTDDTDATTAITGTGRYGSRVPTGGENVRAVYRTGTGIAGNVPAARISQLMSRPLGVSAVVNPLASTGGADRESLERGRRNLPLGVLSLDRLVSVPDYEDFTRARAGIGHASAVSLSDGSRRVVHLTIAGAADAPIDASSDLYRSLREALMIAGDPAVPVVVAVRELALLVIAADVRIDADRRWNLMEPVIRARLLAAFSFETRALGRDVYVSEVQAAIQKIPGVVYSDVNTLATVAESITPTELEGLAARLTLPPSGRVAVSFARYETSEIVVEAGTTLTAIAAANGVSLDSARPAQSVAGGQGRPDRREGHAPARAPAGPDRAPVARGSRHPDPSEPAVMTTAERTWLTDLLPYIYRLRDEEAGGPLGGLLSVVAEQVKAVEDDVEGLYADWFIETCRDWVVPYVGELIGYRPGSQAVATDDVGSQEWLLRSRYLIPRRDVANSLSHRQRKGTLALLEQLAFDVSGWPARAVEHHPLLVIDQHLNHLRLDRGRTADLRDRDGLDLIGGAFDDIAHAVAAGRIDSRHTRRRHDIPNVGLFVWRLQPFSVTRAPARNIDRAKNRFTFDVLGVDQPLVTKPVEEPAATHIADELNVPAFIRRIAFDTNTADYYGRDDSLCLYRPVAGSRGEHPKLEPIPGSAVVSADLSGWHYRPRPGQVAIDPVLGRIAFHARESVNRGIWVSYQRAFLAAMGGGEYVRPLRPIDGRAHYGVGRGGAFTTIGKAYDQWQMDRSDPEETGRAHRDHRRRGVRRGGPHLAPSG